MIGFRHKKTGTLYFNATTQTTQRKKQAEVYSRATQTVLTKNRYHQTNKEQCTQGVKKWLYRDDAKDVVVPLSGSYETARELHARRLTATITIQRIIRGCIARRLFAQRKKDKAKAIEQEKENLECQKKQEEDKKNREIARRTCPKTRADFNILFRELDIWFQKEIEQIKEMDEKTDERRHKIRELTMQRTRHHQRIEKLQIEARRQGEDERKLAVLQELAAPENWILRNSYEIEVHTPLTTDFAQKQQLYETAMDTIGDDLTRKALLKHLLSIPIEQSPVVPEIHSLAHRELDFLSRNLSFRGLQSRLNSYVYDFCLTKSNDKL